MSLTDTFDNPQSRVEAILQNAMGAEHEVVPQSRVEELLERLDDYLEQLEDKIEEGAVTPEELSEAVSSYLDEHLTNPTNPPIDTSLSIAGAAADAKKTGDEIAQVKSDLKGSVDANTGVKSIFFTKGKYVPNSGNTIDVTDIRSNSSWECAVVACSEGDVFTITGRGGSETYLYAFVDSSQNSLETSGSNANLYESIIIAPTSAAYIVVNCIVSYESHLFKGEVIHKRLADLDNRVSETNDDVRQLFPETENDKWELGNYSTDTGSKNDNTDQFIRNTEYYSTAQDLLEIKCDEDYKMLVFAWDKNDVFVGSLKIDGTFSKQWKNFGYTNNFKLTNYADYKFKITLRKNDLSTLTPADGEHCHFVCCTDKTLSLNNKIADAKAVGEKIAEVYDVLGVKTSEIYSRIYSSDKEIFAFDEAADNKLYIKEYGASPSYSDTVPENALTYATLKAIGGKSIISNSNLLPSPVVSVISKSASNTTIDNIEIDENIIAICPGYGEGANPPYYNEIDFANRKYIKRVNTIKLSSLLWGGTAVAGLYTATLDGRIYTSNALCSKYTVTDMHHTVDKTIYLKDSNYGTYKIAIYDTSYTNLQDFRNSLFDVYLCYPLSEPVEVDLPQNVSSIKLRVVRNGTVTFDNANNEAVPVRIQYNIKKPGQTFDELCTYTLDQFEGETTEDKLHTALNTVSRGYILCGEISITKPYVSKQNKYYQSIVLVGATFYFGEFEGAWFNQKNSAFNNTVIFSNCYFVGNGTSTIFSDESNVVQPKFTACKFYNICIAKLTSSRYVQSLYLMGCDFDLVDSIATASTFYDLKMIGCRVERGPSYYSQSGNDTLFKAGTICQATIAASLVEEHKNYVVSVGDARGVVIEGCYFEHLSEGVIEQTNQEGKCAITVRDNSYIGTFSGGYLVKIESENYKNIDGHLYVSENYVQQLTGEICNVTDHYVTMPDGVKRKIVYNQDGTVTWEPFNT